jgi:RimJ/RimL family protein N-acetyltransferase
MTRNHTMSARVPTAASSDSSRTGFRSFVDGRALHVHFDSQRSSLEVRDGDTRTSFSFAPGPERRWDLAWDAPCSGDLNERHLLAALDAASASLPQQTRFSLACGLPPSSRLVRSGAVRLTGERAEIDREALWQEPRLWLPEVRDPSPLRYAVTGSARHPLRPPRPAGVVYRRFIPWLEQVLELRSVDVERDLPVFNRWMNEPSVAHFWQEQGDLDQHRKYLQAALADPRVTPLLGCFDGVPFGYFEVYWAKEDRIAPFYDASDFDRGWHALVGELSFRGQPYLTAWMPSISHYLFLDDCRTQRLVIEPRSDNQRMLKSLGRCGYAHLKEFDFPHKRAVLGMLLRERFFGEALWIPRAAAPDPALRPPTVTKELHAHP